MHVGEQESGCCTICQRMNGNQLLILLCSMESKQNSSRRQTRLPTIENVISDSLHNLSGIRFFWNNLCIPLNKTSTKTRKTEAKGNAYE